MTATPLDPATVARLVDDAVTAPSMHNAQPWKFVFRAGSGTLALYGDPDRAMTRTDPNHRALHLGCAAALFNLRVSAARNGLPVRVRLLPDDCEPWLLATVAVDETAGEDHPLASLHGAVRRRRTSRYPFGDEPVPSALLDGLVAAARLEGCRLTVPDAWHMDTVLGLVRDAEHREEIDPLVRAETAAWASPCRALREGVATAFPPPRSDRRVPQAPHPYATSVEPGRCRIAAGPCSRSGRSWPCSAPRGTRGSTGCTAARRWSASCSRPRPTAWPPR